MMSSRFLALAAAAYYLLASTVCFIAYACDKGAARRRGTRRTPERSLLLLGLAGGWPGGWLARHWLRHKTVKQPFRTWFWFTVMLNVGVLAGVTYALSS